jgi:ABC-type sugar transport system ATPase subunit
MQPKAILFDEPTSALDPELVGDVLGVMRKLADDGMTMLVVTHEMAFAKDVADRVLFIDGGVIVEQGPAKAVLNQPQHARTQDFLRRAASALSFKYFWRRGCGTGWSCRQPSATASLHGWNGSAAPLLVSPSRSTTLGQANFIGRVCGRASS